MYSECPQPVCCRMSHCTHTQCTPVDCVHVYRTLFLFPSTWLFFSGIPLPLPSSPFSLPSLFFISSPPPPPLHSPPISPPSPIHVHVIGMSLLASGSESLLEGTARGRRSEASSSLRKWSRGVTGRHRKVRSHMWGEGRLN